VVEGSGPENLLCLVIEKSKRHGAVLPNSIDELRKNRGQHVKIEVVGAEKGDARALQPSWQLCTVRVEGGVMKGVCRGCEEIRFERRREHQQE
jgi:hypothetical protein